MSDLSPLARTFARALTHLPAGPPAFGTDLVRAVLDTDEPTAATVLGDLQLAGLALARRDGMFTIGDSAAVTGEDESPDTDAVEAAMKWFVGEIVLADRARDRFARKLSPDYADITTPKFGTSAEALFWYAPHHSWFIALLDELVERDWHELAITLAEAVFGLAGHLGHQQDQVRAAQQALRVLGSLQENFFGPFDGQDDDETRHHNVRVARFQLMLASVLTNLRDFGAALTALGEAEKRGRAADKSRVLAAVARSRGRLHHAAGDLAEAERQLRNAYVMDLSNGDLRLRALSLRRLGSVLTSLGLFKQAGYLLHEAAVYCLELGDKLAHARVLTEVGALHTATGEPVKAIEQLGLALDTMKQQEAGCEAWLGDIYRHLARARRDNGDADIAEECFGQAVERYRLAHRDEDAAAVEAEWHQPLLAG